MTGMSTTSSRWFSCAGLLPLLLQLLLLNPLLLLLPLLLTRAQLVVPIHAIIFILSPMQCNAMQCNAIFLLVPPTFPVSSLLVTATGGDPRVGHLAS